MLMKRLLSLTKPVHNGNRLWNTGVNLNGPDCVSKPSQLGPVYSMAWKRYLSMGIHHPSFDESQKPVTVSLYQIKKTIKASSSSGGESVEGATCVQTFCPVCHTVPGAEAEKGPLAEPCPRIYINKTTGNFTCSSCQYLGRWEQIEKFFLPYNRSPKSVQEIRKLRDAFLEIKKEQEGGTVSLPVNAVALDAESAKTVLIQLQLDEHIIPETLVTLKARWNSESNELVIPLVDVEDRVVGFKTLRRSDCAGEITERTIPDANLSGIIYLRCPSGTGAKAKDQSQTNAILVLTVLDLLALGSVKLNATAVCLPHGLKNLPQQCLPALERFQRLTLWFNYDTAGWDTARHYAKKLDERRCLFVRPTDQHPTPYQALGQKEGLELRAILAKAQTILHQSITTFRTLRQDVLSDLQNIDKVQGVKWQRYPSLNKLLKGHRKGELTVLTGPTGCGKTTFMSDYSLDLAQQGVSTLWGSFEIRNTRLAATLLRQMLGRPLSDNLIEFERCADEFERLPIYFMTFHGQQPIKLVMEAIEHAQYVHDINHVIIDNLQFMMGVLDEGKHLDRYWKQDAIIGSFRSFATRRNCHVTLVIHPRKERDTDELTTSSIFGGAKASQEADNVLIIQDKRLTSVRGKKYLQVAKNRYSGDLGIMPLDFDKASLSYAQRKKQKEGSDDTTTEPGDAHGVIL
ncbi:mitochondrial DNA helicase [Anopheles bellator]|uniref:mitochondrial DNA helicase n=1 Tax=Anopheles bellator TaxID=139047 RepID=UPI002648DEC3|nr:mitochondrial DNA helicase [Anopheles bellator]